MMYFTKLPNHRDPGFNERSHFDNFKQHNIIFNALTSKSHCDRHVGCLSIKTVVTGEEVYGVDGLQKSVRPGQFLILNDDQPYSSRIDESGKVKSLSVFFQKEFAAAVFHDILCKEETLLDNPFESSAQTPGFFQTLYPLDASLQRLLSDLITQLEDGQSINSADEQLVLLLNHLLTVHQSAVIRSHRVHAIKPGTRAEIHRRLIIVKDLLHATFMN